MNAHFILRTKIDILQPIHCLFMPIFLSCDWGTSNMRLRVVDSIRKTVLKEVESKEGIRAVYRMWQSQPGGTNRSSYYLSFLEKYLAQIDILGEVQLKNPIMIISGMASSSIGLLEIEYARLPLASDGSELILHRLEQSTSGFQHIYLVSGTRTDDDVMRGEETLLAGCDILPKKLELFLLPGTHSKHIIVNDGRAEYFHTYMTGEFFDIISKHSILSASLESTNTFNEASFQEGLQDGWNGNVLHSAFKVRVNQLFKRATRPENYDYLSGLLIGAELKDIGDQYARVTVVASTILTRKYISALQFLMPDQQIGQVNATEAMLKGHCRIFEHLRQTYSI